MQTIKEISKERNLTENTGIIYDIQVLPKDYTDSPITADPFIEQKKSQQ